MAFSVKKTILFLILTTLSIFSISAKELIVGISLDNIISDRWLREVELMKRELTAEGIEVHITAARGNHIHQMINCTDMINLNHIDVLIIVPVDGKKAAEIVAFAQSKKVKVIAYDRLIEGVNLDYYLAFDAKEIGKKQSKYVLNNITHSGNLMVIGGPIYDYNTRDVKEGQFSILQPAIDSGNVNLVSEHYLKKWSKDEVTLYLDSLFKSRPDLKVDALMAANDMIAEAAIKYFETNNMKNIIITGMDAEADACQRIKNNKQSMSVYGNLKMLAHYCVELTLRLAEHKHLKHIDEEHESIIKNGRYNVKCIHLESITLTKENVSEIIEQHKIFGL